MVESSTPDLCVALANHWSYTGIGWQLGLESCAQSIADSLTMADYEPSVKTGLNLDALAYELVAEHYPEIIARLKTYLDDHRVEIIGGTYGQPMGSMVSGESNLRQMVMGQETIRAALGRHVAVFLEEEEMSFPQVPQLAKLAGYKYASLAQCDTWGRHGAPRIERNVIKWEGVDGTRIVATPTNTMVFHPPCVTHDIDWLWSAPGRQAVETMKGHGQPALVLKWTEFGWESLGGKAINKFDPELFRTLSSKYRVEYVTVEEYLDRHGRNGAAEPVKLKMDDFAKLLPWGVGGDQIRRIGREIEAVLLAAERFEAAGHALGLGVGERDAIAQAWKQLLISQSHDVSLCEYSRWQSSSPPREPVMDAYYLTWGALGTRHMDRAMALGKPALQRTLSTIAEAVDTAGDANALAIVAFNPCGFDRDVAATTGKFSLANRHARGLRVRNSEGKEVPWQLLDHGRDEHGELTHAEMAFQAKQLPGVGYDTFHLETTGETTNPPATDLRIDPAKLEMENGLVKITLDPVSGAIAGLVDQRTGRNLLDARRAFPTLTGKTNATVLPAKHTAWGGIVESYDSAKSQAEITWIEKGPLRATVRASHPPVRAMRFEVYTTLTAGSPTVQVHTRLFLDMPPQPPDGKINGWQLELDIDDGYWLEFAPAFEPATIIRDYPFGVEPCGKKTIDALTFMDLLAADGSGLLVAHCGTQYFKRRDDGVIANLVVREWESHFTGEYGWPRVCDYRYTLTPHGAGFTNVDRLHAAVAMDRKPRCVVVPAKKGTLPRRQSFVRVEGDGVILSAFRRRGEDSYELRMVECGGAKPQAAVSTTLPFTHRRPIDALGQPLGDAESFRESPGRFDLTFRGWEVKNMELKQ